MTASQKQAQEVGQNDVPSEVLWPLTPPGCQSGGLLLPSNGVDASLIACACKKLRWCAPALGKVS